MVSSHSCINQWFLRHDDELYESAIAMLTEHTALRDALPPPNVSDRKHKEGVSRTLLNALGHTAAGCSYAELQRFIAQRRDRRRKLGSKAEREADFWEKLLQVLQRTVPAYSDQAREVCPGAASRLPTQTLETLVSRAFLRHFVHHALFLAATEAPADHPEREFSH